MTESLGPGEPHGAWRGRAAPMLVALEGAGLVAATTYYAVGLFRGLAADDDGALASLFLIAVGAVSLLLMARSLALGSTWPRTPAVLVQAFVAVAAWPLVFTDRPYVGVLLLVLAAGTTLALLAHRRAAPDHSSMSRPSRS